MELVKDLTAGQKAFLVSYFPSIFDEDAAFAEADEETFVDELSATEFSDGDAVHGRLVNIAKALQSKNMLREVIADPADSGQFLTVRFNETTARIMFALVQETKLAGTFYDLARLPTPGSSMSR